mgnify:FL=1
MCHPAFRIYITVFFLLPLTFGCANNTDSTEAPLNYRKVDDSIFLSQIEEYEQLKQKYPFIQFDLNRLENDSTLLLSLIHI